MDILNILCMVPLLVFHFATSKHLPGLHKDVKNILFVGKNQRMTCGWKSGEDVQF